MADGQFVDGLEGRDRGGVPVVETMAGIDPQADAAGLLGGGGDELELLVADLFG